MFFSLKSSTAYNQQSGFTLLELLIVISLIATLAVGLTVSYSGVDDHANYDASRYEMTELRNALLQFRQDSGSHDFPNQGVYDCDDGIALDTNTPNPNISAQFPSHVASLSTEAEKVAWCRHPANFWMLFIDPLNKGWNRDTRRGWNGPYLQRKSGYVDIDADYETDGTFATNTGTFTNNVHSIASPFLATPSESNLTWRTNTGDSGYSQHGTPYLLFDLDDESQARIVSLAADHQYEPIDSPNCEQQLDSDDNPKDIILCLLK